MPGGVGVAQRSNPRAAVFDTTMSEESQSTLSQRRRQLIRQGDSQIRGRRSPDRTASGADGATAVDVDIDVAPHAAAEGQSDELVDGRFRLLRRLGSGRLGEICEARVESGPETALERLVALQLFDRRIAADLALIDKLRRGYAALRAGPHRNVVRFEELGRDRRTWYVVMERLDGVSLRFVVDDAGALPVSEAMPIVRSAGDALSYLHAKGMVHGAVTPSSVFVTEDYEVKLLDIVPALPPSGLPAESMPDSRKASAPDPAEDVFGLACLTYELLTGRHPYNYATAAEAARLGLEPAVIGQLPPVRWQALARGLATAREQRTTSVAVFLLDLGLSGAERLTASDGAPQTGAIAPADDEAPLIPTARDRLVMAPSPEPRRSGWFWPVFGAAVVGFLAAVVWVYQIPIRDIVVEQLTAAGINVIAGRGDGAPEANVAPAGDPVREAARAASSDEVAPVNLSTGTEAIVEAEAVSGPAAMPPPETASSLEVDSEPETTPASTAIERRVDVESTAESRLSAAPIAAEPPIPSRFVFGEGSFRAVEGGSAAAVTIRREGGTAAQAAVVWWTTDDTARSGEDYADLGRQTEIFEPGIESLTLYVPLVDDGLAEPPEGFLVHIGQPNPDTGRVDPIATIGVIIQDDDSSPR